MICVQLNGGLGNQMFQYACARSLAYLYQTNVVLDKSQLRNNQKNITTRSYCLDIFNIQVEEISESSLRKVKPLIYRIINTLFFKIFSKGIQTSKYFIENGFRYNSAIKKVQNNCFLSGYWQSPLYFQSIEHIIRNDFSFPDNLSSCNEIILNDIKNTNSVSLHVRRTDFINNSVHDIHGFCSLDYYRGAMNIILGKVENPIFFVFSDDIEWVKENLKIESKVIFVSGNSGKKSYIDMQLMSLCKHNIIANSSFSWWGAWLNKNENKIVIAPQKWFAKKNLNDQTVDLIPPTWIRI